MTIVEVFIAILMIVGAIFVLVASLGLLRLPDLYARMSATTKAATLGVGFVLLAMALFFNELSIAARALAVIVFIGLTAPVAAHRIARAAYFNGCPLWEGTVIDELRGRYDPQTHTLNGGQRALPARLKNDTESNRLPE